MVKNKLEKLINFIITILFLSLTTIILSISKTSNEINEIPIVNDVVAATSKVNLLDSKALVTKLNRVSKLIVYEGNLNIRATYSNKEIPEDDVSFKWLKGWLNNINSKDLIINSNYNFSFTYDLKDTVINITSDNIPIIHISKNRLAAIVELNENTSFYSDRVGLLESDFTPTEINSLNARTKELVYNKLINDSELRDKAIEQLQLNLEQLLGMECKFIIPGYDVLEADNEIKITN